MRQGRSRVMAVAAALFVTCLMTGCDGASEPAGTSTRTPTPDESSPAANPPSGQQTPDDGVLSQSLQDDLSERLIRPTEFAGAAEQDDAKRFLTPQELAASDPRPGADAQYEREALAGAASMHLSSPGSNDAITTVLKFGSPASARSNLESATDVPDAGTITTFVVAGVPEARGVDLHVDGELVGRNVAFTVGPYEYILGIEPDPAASQSVSRRELAAVAARWYDRVSRI